MVYKDTLLGTKKYQKLLADLFEILEKEEVTRYKIHKKTKMDQTRLSRVYNKKVPLSMNELIRICDEFSISIELKKESEITTGTKQIINYLSKLIS